MTHSKSGVQCVLLFQKDDTILHSTEILNQYFNRYPMCMAHILFQEYFSFEQNFIKCISGYSLISYICAWQTVLKNSGVAKFEFNTYIISVLAIFFLQINYGLPTVDNLRKSTPEKSSNVTNIKPVAREFFSFYAKNYNMASNVISVQIGRWQPRIASNKQNVVSAAEKR